MFRGGWLRIWNICSLVKIDGGAVEGGGVAFGWHEKCARLKGSKPHKNNDKRQAVDGIIRQLVGIQLDS